MANVVSLATDNSSTGLKNGLIKHFRDEISWVEFVCFFSHRLELALKDALSEWLNTIATNLQNSHFIHEISSKKALKLKELNEILKDVYIFENNKADGLLTNIWF